LSENILPFFEGGYFFIQKKRSINRSINMQNTQTQKREVIKAAGLANISLEDLLLAAQKLSGKAAPVKQRGVSWRDFRITYTNFAEAERRHSTIVCVNLSISYLERLKPIEYLSDITPGTLLELKHYLLSVGKHPPMINRVLVAIKTIMRWAERRGDVAPQTWSMVKPLRQAKGRLIYFTGEELRNILAGALKRSGGAAGAVYVAVLLGARAGLRLGEILNLKWCDVDFNAGQLYIAPNKTDNFRYVPLSGDLRDVLLSCQREDEYVIKAKNRHTIKGKARFSLRIKKIILRAGLKQGSTHTLRHTFASHLCQRGVDLYTLSKLLGHTSVKTTEIYAHLSAETKKNAISKLPVI
jgi:integrase